VAGFAPVNPGWTYNLEVPIEDESDLTPLSFAMLHVDDGQVGVYEFDGQSGLDAPVFVDGEVVTPAFQLDAIHAHDQFVEGDTVEIHSVTAQVDGWLVIHSDNNGAPGPVLGQTQVLAGITDEVEVTLQADGRTEVLWPMLHVDTGVPGEYEFGAVPGADAPVITDGQVATLPIWTVDHVRVPNQIVLQGDGQGEPGTSVHVDSVLATVPGFLVIHVDNNGAPGPVAGFVAVDAGVSENVSVDALDPALLTPVLWPMLHVDTGVVGEYEFGSVPGADAPVFVDGSVLTFPINAAPSIVVTAQDPTPGEAEGSVVINIGEALISGQGWLAIHKDNNGQPGPVAAVALLHDGSNKDINIELSAADAGTQVFPMLHYDTGVVGEYEFGTVPDADAPVIVNGQVVVVPLALSTAVQPTEAAPTQEATEPVTASTTCTVTTRTSVNVRSSPTTADGTNIVGRLDPNETGNVTGQTQGGDGFIWFVLDEGSFVRSDVVVTAGDCSALASVEAPAAAEPVVAPNATEEAGG
jgi:hypothetical protein